MSDNIYAELDAFTSKNFKDLLAFITGKYTMIDDVWIELKYRPEPTVAHLDAITISCFSDLDSHVDIFSGNSIKEVLDRIDRRYSSKFCQVA